MTLTEFCALAWCEGLLWSRSNNEGTVGPFSCKLRCNIVSFQLCKHLVQTIRCGSGITKAKLVSFESEDMALTADIPPSLTAEIPPKLTAKIQPDLTAKRTDERANGRTDGNSAEIPPKFCQHSAKIASNLTVTIPPKPKGRHAFL